MKNRVIVIVGPTASGKTTLALEIAEKNMGKCEIICADAFQMYRGIENLVAMPTVDEMSRVPHHFFEIADGDERWNAGKWRKLACEKIREIQKRGNVPILTGGTMLWVDGFLRNLKFEKVDEGVREMVKNMAENAPELENFLRSYSAGVRDFKSTHALRAAEKILAENVESGNGMDPPIFSGSDFVETLSDCENSEDDTIKRDSESSSGLKNINNFIENLNFEVFSTCEKFSREELYSRIDLRTKNMFLGEKIFDEVRKMREKYGADCAAARAIGFVEICGFLDGEMLKTECENLMAQKTRNYAKRQLTWWRGRIF